MNDAALGVEAPGPPTLVETGRVPIIFIRHGETDWNRQARLQGQKDIPLNALGERQAARNGRALTGILSTQCWRAVASPLQRATHTMRIVLAAAGKADMAFDTEPLLKELSYGQWEGMTLPEVAARDPDGARRREVDKWGFVPPSGESYAFAAKRVVGWLETLRKPTLVVAHGGILRILLHRLAGLPAHDAPHLATPQDRVVLFTREAVFTI